MVGTLIGAFRSGTDEGILVRLLRFMRIRSNLDVHHRKIRPRQGENTHSEDKEAMQFARLVVVSTRSHLIVMHYSNVPTCRKGI